MKENRTVLSAGESGIIHRDKTMRYIVFILVALVAIIIGLGIGNAIDNQSVEKQELIPYPEFETVLTQSYCKGMADITLAEEWDKRCAKLLRERHCSLESLEPETVERLILQAERSIQMCER